jgi:predicted tellurium resistance membrane protein TerC
MLEFLSTPEAWLSLFTLTILEIVLGVDNIIFISIITSKLPKQQQLKGRRLGLFLALFIRIVLLAFINKIVHDLTDEIINILGIGFSWRDIILLSGGVFLLYKSGIEIYEKLEKVENEISSKSYKSFWNVVMQVIVIDIVFSFDSILTAVAISDHIEIMVIAVIISMVVMMIFAQKVGDFINDNPSMKILALAFLVMIGGLLTVEAFDVHVEKSYIYFALAFSILVEMLNLRYRKNIQSGKIKHH